MDTQPTPKQPFEAVVSTYSQMVFRVCRVVVGEHDAEDAWTETFLAAMRAYPDLPPNANVEAWLVTIAHRKAIDIVRARHSRAIPVEALPDRPSSVGIPDLDHHDLWAAVKSLPPKQRQAVAYHYVAGLPYADIAEILGGTAAAARRAAADGIATLRSHYQHAPAKEEIR
jgi:RNA polymerase sigma factor (sigma-70 family)